MNIAIDIGNTRTKIGIFDNNEISSFFIFDNNSNINLKEILKRNKIFMLKELIHKDYILLKRAR